MDIQNKKQWNEAFLGACREGDLGNVRNFCQKEYLDQGWADIHFNDEEGFRWACKKGHLEVVKYLLTSKDLKEAGHSWCNPHARNDAGFYFACSNEHWNVVRWLVLDYEIKKTPDIEKIMQEYPQAQEYFRVHEELKEIHSFIKEASLPHQDHEYKEDQRAAKKAKKL